MNPRFRLSPGLFPALAILAAAAAAGIVTARGQTTLVGDSPFAPSGMGAAGAAAAPQDFELAGSTSEGSAVTVCVYERRTKHSQWIPVGGIGDGIKVVSFDGAHDRAVVIVAGVRKEIAMRKATYGAPLPVSGNRPMLVVASVQAPPPDPVGAPPPAAAAATPEQEQREARMLVSDLLEIGVQQRKAYQDAKLKAATAPAPGQSN
jgi:hypothetical protein